MKQSLQKFFGLLKSQRITIVMYLVDEMHNIIKCHGGLSNSSSLSYFTYNQNVSLVVQ